jgi:hypothetical protein
VLQSDVLDDFSKPAPAASSSRGADAPTSVPGFDDPELDDELAKELARGMDQLLNGMSEHPDLKSQMEALVQTLEKDMPALAQAAGESAGQAAAASGKGKAKAEKTSDAFQDKIQETLNKMRSGQEKVGVGLGRDSPEDPFLIFADSFLDTRDCQFSLRSWME